jgi:hypothetical protein
MLILHIFNATNDQDLSRIPQFVVYSDLPQTRGKIVACTQPRRLTTISAAKRVADEMDGVFSVPLMFSAFSFHPSPLRKAGRIFHSFRGHDGPGNDLFKIHD